MTREQENLLSEIHRRVTVIDTQLRERGGVLHRLDGLDEKVEDLRSKHDEQRTLAAKGIGAIAIISALFAAFGSSIAQRFINH